MTHLLTEVIKDAERYRWLRQGDNDERVLLEDCAGSYLPRNEGLDAAIDRLIEIDKQHGHWL